jgi:hypothetical protein
MNPKLRRNQHCYKLHQQARFGWEKGVRANVQGTPNGVSAGTINNFTTVPTAIKDTTYQRFKP